MNQGPTLQGDFLAVAVIDGKVELSFNLGKQTKPVRIISDVSIFLSFFTIDNPNSYVHVFEKWFSIVTGLEPAILRFEV